MNTSTKTALAIVSVLLLASVAFVPTAEASTGAELPEPVVYGSEDDPEYGAIFIALWLVIGLVATAAGGGYVAGLNAADAASDDDNAGDQEAVNQAFRKAESTKLIFAADTAKNIISTVLPADSELWYFTIDHWQKTIEYVVSANWFKDNLGYQEYMNDNMVGSGLPQNAANYLYTWSAAIDNSYNNIIDYYLNGVATEDYSNGMEVYLDYGSGAISMGDSPGEGNRIVIDFTQIAKPSSGADKVFIDTSAREYDDESYCHTIYVFGDTGATLTYEGPDGNVGRTYTLNKGANDIDTLGMPTGIYTLQTGHTYAGNIVPLGTDNASNVYGGMVVGQGSALQYFIPTSNDSLLAYYNANDDLISDSISELLFSVDFNGPNGDVTESSTIFGIEYDDNNPVRTDLIGNYNTLVQQIDAVAYNTHVAGYAAWDIFDIAEESNQFIKPSSIIPNVPGQTLTAADIEGVYIAAMKQLLEFAEGNESDFDGWVTNTENIGLYCYGDIYRDGKLWAENVVFTPYITTADQHLQIGTNTWNGDGFAMIWDQTPTFSYDMSVSASQYYVDDLEPGDVIIIDNMAKLGEPITEIDLTRAEIQKWNTGSDGGDGDDAIDDEDISVLDAQIMMLIIIVELGLLILTVGFLRGLSPFIVIGFIVIAVGVLWPQVFTSLLLDDFTMSDLWPLAWI